MSEGKHFEIERKYLIAMPDTAMLAEKPGCAVWEIEQIYLIGGKGVTRRIRRVVENGETRWYKTFKRRVSAVTAEEDEGQISQQEYDDFRIEANPLLKPVVKTRYRVPYEGQLLEFDVYPFWTDRAVMEIELESEDAPVYIPEWVRVLKEVTDDVRYKNYALAQSVPMDEI